MFIVRMPSTRKSKDIGRAFTLAMHHDFVRDVRKHFVTLPFAQSRVILVERPKERYLP